ncbi:MAG: cold shock domain-containing protein [Bryobacterales bacterium]|nr:cold shock domain-containing protein [Bryobacterales bacterium]
MQRGTVATWRHTYGFIETADHRRIFVHYSNICGTGYRALAVGDVVDFEIAFDDSGRRYAVRVVPTTEAAA